MAKPLLGLFYGEPGTNKWKRTIEEMLHKGSPASVTEVVERSMEHIPAEILDASPQAKYVTRTETDSEGNRKRVFSVVD